MVYRVAETLKNQYVFVAAFTLPAAAVERLCSVHLIADYECVPRTCISVAIILILDVFSFTQSFAMALMGNE